jgi:agmatinase
LSGASTRFLDTEVPDLPPEKARFHVLPVPYEKTVSYGRGTALGPGAIIASSGQLERFDGTSDPGAEGIYTWPAVDCSGAAERVIDAIALAVKKILKLKKIPVVLGGEHTVTWGVIKGYLDAGEKDFGVVQIDAHADLRDAYEGDRYSHASVMRRVVEAGVPLVQLGNRAYCEEERDARKKHKVLAFDANEIVPNGVSKIKLPKKFPGKVFFTLDVDGIDPSVLPATGTPVPGGLGWYQTLGLFESVARQRRIIGFDVMEFAPIPGFHAFDFAAALLTYKMMGIVQRYSAPGRAPIR